MRVMSHWQSLPGSEVPVAKVTAAGAIKPKMSTAAMAKANLSAVQRIDKDVTGIDGSTGHGVIYAMKGAEGWVKDDCEGPVFITKRKSKPYCRMFCTNRLSLTNFSEDITTNMQLQVSPAMNGSLLAYQNTKGDVKGVWCSSEAEMTEFEKKLRDAITNADKAPPKEKKEKKEKPKKETLPKPQVSILPRPPVPEAPLPAGWDDAPAMPANAMPASLAALFASASVGGPSPAAAAPAPGQNISVSNLFSQASAMGGMSGPPLPPSAVPMPPPPVPAHNDAVSDFFNKFSNGTPPLPQAASPPRSPTAAPTAPGSQSLAVPAFTPGAAGHMASGVVAATGGIRINRVQLQHTLYSLTMNEEFLEHVYSHLQTTGNAS